MMSKRMFDFECNNGHMHEALEDSEVRQRPCKVCGETAERLISTPSISLDGCSGAFPGESMKWERQRAERQAQERTKSYFEQE